MLFQRFSEIDHITNEFLDPMNAAITRFVERQLFLNSDMSAKELSAVKSKGRMGYLALQDSLATVNRYMSQKSLSEDPTSSEYKLFSESVEVDKTTFHKRQNSLTHAEPIIVCSAKTFILELTVICHAITESNPRFQNICHSAAPTHQDFVLCADGLLVK